MNNSKLSYELIFEIRLEAVDNAIINLFIEAGHHLQSLLSAVTMH